MLGSENKDDLRRQSNSQRLENVCPLCRHDRINLNQHPEMLFVQSKTIQNSKSRLDSKFVLWNFFEFI